MMNQVRIFGLSIIGAFLLIAFQNCGEVKFQGKKQETEPVQSNSVVNTPDAEIFLDDSFAAEGEPARLDAIVDGDLDNPSFVWLKDGEVVAGEGDSSLVIASAEASDQGVYEVILIDGSTEKGRAQALLTVVEPESNGALIGSQLFTSSGTYTPTPGAKKALVMVVGGGGGGGGGGHNFVFGAPGGKGASFSAFIPVSESVEVTVGAGGVRGRRAADGRSAGGVGGSSSFGDIIVAEGGAGGGMTNSHSLPAPAAQGKVVTDLPDSGVVGLVPEGASSNTGLGGNAGNDWWGNGSAGGSGVVYILEFD